MTDYSQLSDRDIDALVLQKIYGNQASDKDIMRAWLRGGFKYTTNPADAWPIIQANKISLVAPTKLDVKEEWIAYLSWESDECVPHVNPLQAGMIAFLMMKDAENAPAI